MDKQHLIEKTTETLRPFETANVINTMQGLSVKQVFSHPAVLFFILVVFFYGIVRRSKPILLTLFMLVGLAGILRYAMPTPGDNISISSMLPFVGGSLVIGCVIIYFSLIKSD